MEFTTAILVALATVTAVYGQVPVDGCRKVLDLVLVVDGSDSISGPDFKKIKSSITDLISRLDVERDQIWFGLVLYSSNITEYIELENDKNKLLQRISLLEHAQMGTNTALGVQTMDAILKSGREGVPKMGVVITDGLSKDPAATHEAAVQAIASGVRMFSVGIGKLVHFGELGGLASGPGYTLNFTDFDELSLDFIEDVASNICVETVSECPGPLDLIVVVDGSDSIFNDDFSAIKTAILGLLDTLILGEDNVKFGLVLYSSNITTVLALSSNKEHIRTRISTLTHSRQGTNTHLGIRKMNSMFAHHGRKGIPKAGIVITDGISKLPKKTAAAAAIAKRKNTNMYAVGITKHIDMNELENIASSDERVISLKNFSQLKIGITSLMKQVCPVITTTTTTTTTTAATTTTTAATTTAAAATTSAAAAETTATAATDSSTAATMPEKSTAETQTLPSDCVTSGNKVTLPNEDIEREEKERGGDDDNAGDDDDSKVSRLPKHRGGSSDEDEYPNSNTSQNNMTPGLLNLLFGRRRANKTGYRQYRREDDDDYRQYRRDYGGYGHYRRAYFDDDYRHNRQGYGGSSNMYHRYDDK